MRLSLTLTHFADGAEVVSRQRNVELPPPGPDLQHWADEHLVNLEDPAFTNENRLLAVIEECIDRPDLVGHEFRWVW